MSVISETVYNELLDLCKDSECFYFVDQQMDGHYFRIFNYRLAQYSDWLKHPLTFELRGLMIETTSDGRFIRVASRPMKKFFNRGENPIVADYDFSGDMTAYDKMDGSLISTYMTSKGLRLKSKASLASEQAKWAMELLDTPEYRGLKDDLIVLQRGGITVDLEFCAPFNRVVIGYEKPSLTVLGMRRNRDGETLNAHWAFVNAFNCVGNNWADARGIDIDFLDSIPDMKGIEGFVIHLADGNRVKVKTTEYLNLHHAKDGVSQPKKIAQVILDDTVDDVKTLFSNDMVLLNLIERMEKVVKESYNHLVVEIEGFWNANKELDRKSYAIKAQAELPGKMSLAMNLFLGRDAGYKEFFMKNFEQFVPDTDWYSLNGTTN